jgi:cell division protein FtsZ
MHVNVDFNDVKTVMQDSGVAIMGSAIASGEKRAIRAVEQALVSPLLNDNDISGARHVLLNIMSGSDDIEMDEFGEITDFIQEAAGGTAELITGYGTDPSLGNNVSVTIIATGFNAKMSTGYEAPVFAERKLVRFDEAVVTKIEPIQTTIIDKIEKNEPFVFVKDESSEIPASNNNDAALTAANNVIIEDVAKEMSVFKLEIEESAVEEKNILPLFETPIETPIEDVGVAKSQFIINDVTDLSNEIVNQKSSEDITREEQIRLAQDRIKKLKELTLKMKTPEGLSHLEKESAWQRKQVNLDTTSTPSTDSQVSRFTLGDSDNKNIEIRSNNSFLHDNVD